MRPLSLLPLITLSFASLAGAMRAANSAQLTLVQPLDGEWRFALDRSDLGVKEQWYDRALSDRIKLPGILQAQGYGDEIRTDTPWVETLGDAWWKLQPESLRAKFSQPGNVKVPFLAQPPRHYLGAAWYQRDIEIPDSAQGRRFVLFLERPHWETTVWVDDKAYPSDVGLVAPHITDLGQLAPGKHRLTIRVDNRQVLRDPVNDGHMADAHSVSDALGATWNGIVGRIELQSTPLVWLDDVQVFPNVAKKSVLVKVKIGNASGLSGEGMVGLEVKTPGPGLRADRRMGGVTQVKWDQDGAARQLDVPLDATATTWDEFHPALQHLTVTLRINDRIVDVREVAFGLRDVSWHDKDLLVNGRVVNLRTTHFGGDFPLTGCPAMDVASWKKIFQVCQEYGLNGMRFHSWCPPEAAFTAADELGFYLQPECAMWAPFNPDSVYTKFLEEETPRLLRAYGNHPSFLLLSPSNEPAGHYTEITPKWAAEWYRKDPRHLYSAGTGWGAPAQITGGAQFASIVRFGRGDLRNVRGWFGHDYRAALEGYQDPRTNTRVEVHIPVLAHEVGQWCAYPDFDVIKEFTGYLQPGNFEIFKYIAGQTGVLKYDHAFAHASGRFQLECYKEDIEANLRTPGLSGYQLLDLHDYLGQGTALIGAAVDAFWKPKPYVTAKEFRRFNSQTVPLARLAKRTFTSDEKLTVPVELYHFADTPITGAKSYWRVVAVDRDGHLGKVVAHGEFAPRDIPVGKNIPLGDVSLDLANVPAPAAYKLVVGVAGTDAENDWNFWVYPAHLDVAAPADVLVTSKWAEAEARLKAGGKVLFVPTNEDLDPSRSPAMSRTPVFWNIQMTVRPPRNTTPKFDAMLGLLCEAKHPALAEFPTEANCDWQWTPLIDRVRSVNLTGAPQSLEPIVATIDDWNRDWRLGVIFEANIERGRLLVCTIPLESENAPAGALQLRKSLLDYMASPRFRPAATLTVEQVRQLWKPAGEQTAAPRPRAYDPDLDDGTARPAAKKQP